MANADYIPATVRAAVLAATVELNNDPDEPTKRLLARIVAAEEITKREIEHQKNPAKLKAHGGVWVRLFSQVETALASRKLIGG